MAELKQFPPILGMAILFEGALFALAIGLGAIFGKPALGELTMGIGALAWGIAATFPPLLVMWASIHSSWPPIARLNKLLEESVVPMFRRSTPLELAAISLLAGVGEEALFRGFFHIVVRDATSVWVAVVAVSIVFGLVHYISFAYAVMAALIGAYLAGLLVLFGNLFVPMVTHAAYDFLGLMILTRSGVFDAQGSDGGGPSKP